MNVHEVTADAEGFTCNAYLISGNRPVLIDAGAMPGVVDIITETVDNLAAVYLTHQHTDHVAELDAVLNKFDAELYAYGDHPRRDGNLADGDIIEIEDESFEVVYTPGHASDHITLVGNKRIFSGDVVVYNDGAFNDGSFGRTDMTGQSREQLIESLHRLLERLPRTVERLYPGHGDVYRGLSNDDTTDSIQTVIERALTRAERREPKYSNN
ncbi:MBL fold metallo-hydrolase [Haloquadratum walsbyi]|jgi:Zn-dependent hydrolases, including glyoxylases|uniref:Zn-dependent hydrolase n=1 Tax=Haloquadratum walsbyi J07HQW2 TaxID=1238425 RepID=U1PR77_9EURY|nr:MBL fold metallo-hydrolase [Haloquadratum walsbyi]ERG96272.1 MAG: Zn-dependent hydrolase [Haloquadratum walsbyi J07HQW2]